MARSDFYDLSDIVRNEQEDFMLKFLLVTNHKHSLSGLSQTLESEEDVEVFWADSGSRALDMVSEAAVDLVVADEELDDMTGLVLAGKLLSVNPAINCACVTSLSPQDFHEASEGLGVMGRLPIRPAREDGEKLLRDLRNLKSLEAGLNSH